MATKNAFTRLLHLLLLGILLISTLCTSTRANTALAQPSAMPERQSLLIGAQWFSTSKNLSHSEAQDLFQSNKTIVRYTSQPYLHLSNTEQTYWIQQTLSTEDHTAPQHLHLVIDRQYPQFDNTDLYVATEWETPTHFQQSDRLHTPGSDVKPRMMAFPITLEANKRYTITLAIKSRAQQSLAVELMEPEQFYTSVKNSEFIWGNCSNRFWIFKF